MRYYVSPGNPVGAAVLGFTNWVTITPLNPYGALILDALFSFSVLDGNGNVFGGVSNVPMPLVDASRALYFSAVSDPGFVLNDYYQVLVVCANYQYEVIQQVTCQNRPMLANPQFT